MTTKEPFSLGYKKIEVPKQEVLERLNTFSEYSDSEKSESGLDTIFTDLLSTIGSDSNNQPSDFLESMLSSIGSINPTLNPTLNPKSKIEYYPFKITNIQNYNPIYNQIFELTPKNYNSIGLNHPKQVIFGDITPDKNDESNILISSVI